MSGVGGHRGAGQQPLPAILDLTVESLLGLAAADDRGMGLDFGSRGRLALGVMAARAGGAGEGASGIIIAEAEGAQILRVVGTAPAPARCGALTGLLLPVGRETKVLAFGQADAGAQAIGKQAEVELPGLTADNGAAAVSQGGEESATGPNVGPRCALVEAFKLDPEPIGGQVEVGVGQCRPRREGAEHPDWDRDAGVDLARGRVDGVERRLVHPLGAEVRDRRTGQAQVELASACAHRAGEVGAGEHQRGAAVALQLNGGDREIEEVLISDRVMIGVKGGGAAAVGKLTKRC